jgi:hypothetical protein
MFVRPFTTQQQQQWQRNFCEINRKLNQMLFIFMCACEMSTSVLWLVFIMKETHETSISSCVCIEEVIKRAYGEIERSMHGRKIESEFATKQH